ncbi:MAG: hypothetical protein WC860_08840 [Candidatus Margulisiibacteriota bacterium]|jgi:hypothetical protein
MLENYINKLTKEAYAFFNKEVRSIKYAYNSEVKMWQVFDGGHNDDIDAFRHAYVSGIITKQHGEAVAYALGLTREISGNLNDKQPSEEQNMDLWNNAIGRQYGKTAKSKAELAKLLVKALKNGKLIITTDKKTDSRQYEEQNLSLLINPNKPVIAIQKSKTNRNEIFFDLSKKLLLTRDDFLVQIQKGLYPGYKIMNRNNLLIPMSIQDKELGNNLG